MLENMELRITQQPNSEGDQVYRISAVKLNKENKVEVYDHLRFCGTTIESTNRQRVEEFLDDIINAITHEPVSLPADNGIEYKKQTYMEA